jgi:hypothetical protein
VTDRTQTTKSPTPGQLLSIALAELVSDYQDRLVDAINDQRHTREERDGLRMASALFRAELVRLGITNVPGKVAGSDD